MVRKYTKDEVLKFLKENPIMSAAMCGGSDRPVSTVLLFAVDDNFAIYFATRGGTYKDKALSINPMMSVSVWKHKEMEVQMSGKAAKVTDPKEIDDHLDRLVDAIEMIDDFWAPILRMKGDYVFYRFKPDWVRVLDLSSDSLSESESGFTEFVVDHNEI